MWSPRPLGAVIAAHRTLLGTVPNGGARRHACEHTHHGSRLIAVAESHDTDPLADWSPWLPFEVAVQQAPLLPGVYMARTAGATSEVVYVGMAENGGVAGSGAG